MTSTVSRRVAPATRPLALALAIAAVYSNLALAQTTEDNTINSIVITASRIAQLQSDALPHTTVITSADIRNSQAVDLPTLLRREAGIEVAQSGGPGQATSLFMRGATPAETLILVDGVPVRRQGFSEAPGLEQILPEQIDHIEIVRGNVSALYGSSAIGGVIQIFTKSGKGAPGLNVTAEAGSRGTFKLTSAISGQEEGTRYALSLTRFKTDGFSASNTTQYPSENPDKDGDRNTSITGSVSHGWGDGHEFGARLYANDGKIGYDGGGFGSPTDINTGESKQQSLALFSRDRLTEQWQSTLTLSQTNTRNTDIAISAYGGVSRYNGGTGLLQWANEFDLSPAWKLVAGVDVAREKADVFSDYGYGATQDAYSRSTSSEYAGVNGKFDAHQLQVNIRHDNSGGSGSESTGYVGYGFAVTPALKLIADASTAFHAPTLAQLYDPNYGNPNVTAEHSHSNEFGAQYSAAGTLLRATFFETRTHDQFWYDSAYRTINLNRTRNRGLELSAAAQIADTDLRASLTLQNPKDDMTGAALVRRAKTMGSLSIARSFGALRVGTDMQYTSSRLDPSTPAALGSYWLFNANARYQLAESVSLFGRVDNMFNREYETAFGYNQPPRGVFVGVSWRH